jgi:hypothetical protein
VASLISLRRSPSRAFFHHAFISKVLRSFNTESRHVKLDLPVFLLPSGWMQVIFMQGTLCCFLAIRLNHFSILILKSFSLCLALNISYRVHHYTLLSLRYCTRIFREPLRRKTEVLILTVVKPTEILSGEFPDANKSAFLQPNVQYLL